MLTRNYEMWPGNNNQIRQPLCLKGLSTIPEEWSQIQLYSQIGKAEGHPGQKIDQPGWKIKDGHNVRKLVNQARQIVNHIRRKDNKF